MATYQTGGVKALHYNELNEPSGWNLIAEVIEVENLPEVGIDQQTTNSSYQSGVKLNPAFRFSNFSEFEKMKNLTRERLYFAVEYFDGNILQTSEPCYPKILRIPKARVADGDSLWQLTFELDADQGYIELYNLD